MLSARRTSLRPHESPAGEPRSAPAPLAATTLPGREDRFAALTVDRHRRVDHQRAGDLVGGQVVEVQALARDAELDASRPLRRQLQHHLVDALEAVLVAVPEHGAPRIGLPAIAAGTVTSNSAGAVVLLVSRMRTPWATGSIGGCDGTPSSMPLKRKLLPFPTRRGSLNRTRDFWAKMSSRFVHGSQASPRPSPS